MNGGQLDGKHIWVSGRVQGVFFRKFTQQQAKALGVTGWVKNTIDGKVELKAFGSQTQLEALIAKLWEGPMAAEVTDVVIENIGVELYADFKVMT